MDIDLDKTLGFPKFRKGDFVDYRNSKCIVEKTLSPKNGENLYEIKDLRSGLTHTVYQDDMKFYTDDLKINDSKVNYGKTCPRCGTAWTKSAFGGSKWLDCLCCGKRAEDLVYKSTEWNWKEDTSSSQEEPDDLLDLLDSLYGGNKP